MDEGKARAAGDPGTSGAVPHPAAGSADGSPEPAAPGLPAEPRREAPAPAAPGTSPAPEPAPVPLHAPDPYGTPPYGRPGPWAPAPPVQRPVVTPPHGTHVPPTPPPYAASQAEMQPGVTPAQGTALPAYPQPQSGVCDPSVPAAPLPYACAQPGVTPAQGTALPAEAHAPAAAPAGPWQYDPWAAGTRVPESGEATGGGKGGPTRRRIVTGAVAVALVAGAVGGGIGAALERDGGMTPQVRLPQSAADKGDRAPGSIAGIAARALPGVVTIHVSGGGEQGTGTGFVLDKQGHILTNNHVVQPAGSGGSISVTFNGGQTAKATLVGRDGGYDLAVIKVTGVSGLTPLALGNSDSVRVGDSVVAIGAPFDLAGTVTTGIISAKERPITAGGKKQDGSDVSYVDALQTDAPINPGNSGGPLMDSEARVIGINSAIRSAGESEGGGQGGSIGLGFAIPVNQAKRVAEELINTGRATHPVIGVSLDMGYTGDGARVNADGAKGAGVTSGGPADKAGIRPQDVIKKVDGVPVHSGRELIVKVRSHRPGDGLELTVERDGREQSVRLTLGSASAG
ncbi:trypsin-like peptidase domain-containing protein [Streptomyces cinnamoneus]|uniref:trypsin-like peptidase domain-containing protein n=1 Tax=Streptomyces cinnamoneus TaxID=53446 RepID=UPI0037B3A482